MEAGLDLAGARRPEAVCTLWGAGMRGEGQARLGASKAGRELGVKGPGYRKLTESDVFLFPQLLKTHPGPVFLTKETPEVKTWLVPSE